MIYVNNDVSSKYLAFLKKNKYKHIKFTGSFADFKKTFSTFEPEDILVVASIRSIANNVSKICQLLNICVDKKINIYFEDSNKNIFGTSSLSHEAIHSSTKTLIKQLIKHDSSLHPLKLDKYHHVIMKELRLGAPITAIAKKIKVHPMTLTNWIDKRLTADDKVLASRYKLDSIENTIIKLFNKNLPLTKIADQVNCSYLTLVKWLEKKGLYKKSGVKSSRINNIYQSNAQKIKKRILAGETISDIAKRYNWSYNSLRLYIQKEFADVYTRAPLKHKQEQIKMMLERGTSKRQIAMQLNIGSHRLNRYIEKNKDLKTLDKKSSGIKSSALKRKVKKN